MHAIFICVLTLHPHRPGMYGPKVLRELYTGLPPNVYVTLPAVHAAPVAIGLAELTPLQAALFDELAGTWVFDALDWRTKTVNQIPAAVRQRLNALLTDRGISAGIQMSDTVAQAVGKIVTAIGKDPQELLARYLAETGVEL
jgi:hypothetical protein